jgi:hypothetical protein
MLNEDQERELGTYDGVHVTGVALNDKNECISISTQNWPMRYQLCDNCTENCSWGGYIWTREDYRHQQIFTKLYFWLKESAGIDRTYISKNNEYHFLLADKFNLAIPKSIDDLPGLEENPKKYLPEVEELADKITKMLGGI